MHNAHDVQKQLFYLVYILVAISQKNWQTVRYFLSTCQYGIYLSSLSIS